MKILVGLVTEDNTLRRHFGLGKDGVVPRDSLNRGYFRDRGTAVTVLAWAPDEVPTVAGFERFLLARVLDFDACLVLVDSRWIRFVERVRDSVFVVSFEPDEIGASLRNFFHQLLGRALRGFGKLLARFDRGDDAKLLILPLRNFHAQELAELARLCREDGQLATFGEDVETELAGLRERVRPRRKTKAKRLYIVDDRERFFHYGLERHARFATGEPHFPSCELAGSYRFGRAVDDRRHYNVSESEGDATTISGEFRDCHGTTRKVNEGTHLNMFCNDYF